MAGDGAGLPAPGQYLCPHRRHFCYCGVMTDSPSSTRTGSQPGGLPDSGERIAKYLARAGLCSRRDAEKLIADGRVSVDGKVLDTPAVKVSDANAITVDGVPVAAPEASRLWRYHKPKGLVTTARDPEGRPTVFGKMPPEMPRVISIGRLDISSEGLLLLTNDGELARRLELPATGWTRRYRVRVRGQVDDKALAALSRGITVEGVRYGPIEAARDDAASGGTNQWLTIGLKEGKNREVRRVLGALGLDVSRLIRVSYGPFQLGDMVPGAVVEVPARVLRAQLGQGGGPEGTRESRTRLRGKEQAGANRRRRP